MAAARFPSTGIVPSPNPARVKKKCLAAEPVFCTAPLARIAVPGGMPDTARRCGVVDSTVAAPEVAEMNTPSASRHWMNGVTVAVPASTHAHTEKMCVRACTAGHR
jgi:hypothetical protein